MKILFYPLVVGRDWGWVCDNLPLTLTQDIRGIMAVDVEAQERVAAVVLYGWTTNSVMAHVVITNPMVLRHGLIEEFKRFVFEDAKRKVVIGVVPGDNEKALKFDEHLGFKEVYRIEEGYSPGVDMVILEMRNDEQQERRTRRA